MRQCQGLKQIIADLKRLTAAARREDIAASAQQVLEQVTLASFDKIFARERPRNLAVAGGVFANVKLTQRIAERFPFEEVFVYPAMSDQGEAAGGVLQFLLERDGLAAFLAQREKFGNLYFGRDYTGEADEAFICGGATRVASDGVVEAAARMLAERRILGLYLGRGEYGPRALGARTIMASPADRSINDWLNKRLERTEFMPFAPVVRDERVEESFRTAAGAPLHGALYDGHLQRQAAMARPHSGRGPCRRHRAPTGHPAPGQSCLLRHLATI